MDLWDSFICFPDLFLIAHSFGEKFTAMPCEDCVENNAKKQEKNQANIQVRTEEQTWEVVSG